VDAKAFRRAGRRRRRTLISIAGVALIGSAVLFAVNLAGAAAPGRVYITLEKLCKSSPKQKFGPVFVIHNATNAGGAAQTITVEIVDRYFVPKNGLISGPMTLAPGQTITWNAPVTWPWTSPVPTDHKYYAHYNVSINGVTTHMKTDEYCSCGPSGTTTTTRPSTSSSSTTTTTNETTFTF